MSKKSFMEQLMEQLADIDRMKRVSELREAREHKTLQLMIPARQEPDFLVLGLGDTNDKITDYVKLDLEDIKSFRSVLDEAWTVITNCLAQ